MPSIQSLRVAGRHVAPLPEWSKATRQGSGRARRPAMAAQSPCCGLVLRRGVALVKEQKLCPRSGRLLCPTLAVVPCGLPCSITTVPVALKVKSWPCTMITPTPQCSIRTGSRSAAASSGPSTRGSTRGRRPTGASSFRQRANSAGVNGTDGYRTKQTSGAFSAHQHRCARWKPRGGRMAAHALASCAGVGARYCSSRPPPPPLALLGRWTRATVATATSSVSSAPVCQRSRTTSRVGRPSLFREGSGASLAAALLWQQVAMKPTCEGRPTRKTSAPGRI